MTLIPSFDEELRKLAHQVVDRIFDHIENVASQPVVDFTPPETLREVVRLEGNHRSFSDLVDLIAAKSIQLHHPAYLGHQVCPPFPHAVIADFLVSALNQSNAVWEMSPIATMIEKEVIDWLGGQAGYREGFAGTAVSGGSAANLTALLAARAHWRAAERKGDPVVLCSADAHYSIARAAAIAGIAVRRIPTDVAHRIDVTALREMAREGPPPLAIVATSGSTATGSFDDLNAIADLRDELRTWLHVDAAHGASVLLSERLRSLVTGIERADSFSWDPHKMMWMPLSMGVLLVREARWLRGAFEADAPYLFDARRSGWNLGELTIQCSKRADAVKLWLTLKTIGVAPIVAAMERVTAMTRHLHELVRASPDFEAMHSPEFNIFCFRYRRGDDLDAVNQRIRDRVVESGKAWITSTVLKGRRVLRVTVINPRTSEREMADLLELIRCVATEAR